VKQLEDFYADCTNVNVFRLYFGDGMCAAPPANILLSAENKNGDKFPLKENWWQETMRVRFKSMDLKYRAVKYGFETLGEGFLVVTNSTATNKAKKYYITEFGRNRRHKFVYFVKLEKIPPV
jgi:hypothetical protein